MTRSQVLTQFVKCLDWNKYLLSFNRTESTRFTLMYARKYIQSRYMQPQTMLSWCTFQQAQSLLFIDKYADLDISTEWNISISISTIRYRPQKSRVELTWVWCGVTRWILSTIPLSSLWNVRYYKPYRQMSLCLVLSRENAGVLLCS